MKSTDQLQVGEKVRLLDFGNTTPGYRRNLLALGLTLGTEVMVKRVAPLGCPIEIEVLGAAIALRKNEAEHLLWE